MAISGTVLANEVVWVGFHGTARENGRTGVRLFLDRSDQTGFDAEIEVRGLRLVRRHEEGRDFTVVEIPGAGRTGTLGTPMLPAFRRFVEIPVGAEVRIAAEVLETEKVVLAEHGCSGLLYPLQNDRPKCEGPDVPKWEFHFKPDAYRGTVRMPLIAQDGPYTFRDHTVVRVTFAPVAYDADAGVLEVATRVRFHAEFTGGDQRATDARRARLGSRAFDTFLGRAVINLGFRGSRDAGWHYPDDAPIEFLIITPPQFVATIQPFVEWKTRCGYHVTVATTDTTGTTTSDIKSYISNLYNGQNPPVYILMIGDSPNPLVTYVDVDQYHGSAGGSDLPFVQMDSDLYPDMIIARWPVDDTTELANMMNKILFYEDPQQGHAAYLGRAIFMAGSDYASNGVTTHQDVIADLFGASTPNGNEADFWPETPAHSVQDFIDDLATGRGFAVYSAHSGPSGWSGPPSVSTSDMPNFTNANMYPLGFGHSCQSNMWATNDDVFGETTVIQEDKGFVSYWGGSNSTYWDGDDWLERGFFDSLIPENMNGNMITFNGQFSQGAACYSGLTEVSLQAAAAASTDFPDESYYWHEYNLDGDPTLDPFTHVPDAMTVTAPSAVPPAAVDDFTVTVADSSRGPVGGALVAASQDVNGQVVLLGAGFTDANGEASFHIDAPQAGQTMLVRVTAHNHYPTDANVQVAAGSDGVVLLDAGTYRCDSTVSIVLFDDDLAGNGTQDVTLAASPSGGSLTVTLTEVTGGTVVKYVGQAVLGTDLVVQDGDTLTVTYVDADNGNGGTDVSKTDTAAVDCAGPVVSNVQATATHNSMTITFDTDEPGTTTVVWGTTRPPTQTADDSALVTAHSVTLTGLAPCTRYFFEIVTEDALGNQTVDDNGGAYYSETSAGWDVVFEETLDADPGWTIDNGGNAHGWAFGQPQGQGGSHGSPDPTAGHTGDNVYGVNLAGDYDNSLSADQLKLESASVDCTEMTSVQLAYWRWLGVERSSYDHARIQISVDGGAWSTIWENTATMNGGSWEEHTVDVTSQAAGHGDVRFRWTMGPTDGSWQFCGWNIDDIRVEGAVPCCVDAPQWPSGSDGVDSVAETNTGGSCQLTGLDIDWSPATSTCASDIGYDLWVVKGTTVDFTAPPTFAGLSGTHHRVMGLSSGQQYAVAVRAVDEFGNTDANTHVLTATPSGDLSGDVNGDSAVDSGDIQALLAYFFSGTAPAGHGDVDCSGAIDAGDLAREVQYRANGLY